MINKLLRASAGLLRAATISRSSLYDLWLFALDLLERIVKSALLCSGILFGVVYFIPPVGRALAHLVVAAAPTILALEVLALSLQVTLITLAACLLAGAGARLFYVTRLIYRLAGWVGNVLLIGVPCVYLVARMIQHWIPGVSLLEACLLGFIPTAFLLPPCFDYAEKQIPEFIPVLAGLRHTFPRFGRGKPPGDQSANTAPGEEQRYSAMLGLKRGYTLAELKRQYHELAQQYHPDKVQHLGPKLRATAEQEMKRINEAYQYLEQRRTATEGED